MRFFTEIKPLKTYVAEQKREGKIIGFVPTMGYLHDGHLSLVRKAKLQADVVIVSIFVNPLQFGPNEDFAKYPRDLERDLALLQEEGVDCVFAPSAEEMYKEGFSTFVEVNGEITEVMCGKSRPGHFKGVATVVTKLFNIVTPDLAFFGQKDAQQLFIIEKLVRDLNLNVEIVSVPTRREEDGLAMSSRNTYLNPEERKAATILYRALKRGEELVLAGERNPERLKKLIEEFIKTEPLARIDYVEVRSVPDLKAMDVIKGKFIIALAVYIGSTRLIDNFILEVD
ncbi:pantoate--beta-alanine ligase [Carboxydothermus hydrogenoformans]|uniref:Pantothenate synthetase n=1 Tax=Carboxydothermus hydrogenoformans (strain ATCC BAA-161 / DSM 6008 / Z-2901) TaxID=246194 RepID=PANC_CARHZ|nr:pantoate--beta-alanine ligase [Carboxydothermus hydrogenoformans]Q3A9L1.1 RecName: Full=Pantothenate synthetase; Short=PS; AltName: Full=Pantoate--beta-alanine ligase; AltName: Full=Pantoate-activating enzyme [Carboxydothermus hydrogenoformans Z-2901]ABB14551.1 pantoate--beta-alanine ligase [Carboxydothermus hydrogenoformans Z-2901]